MGSGAAGLGGPIFTEVVELNGRGLSNGVFTRAPFPSNIWDAFVADFPKFARTA